MRSLAIVLLLLLYALRMQAQPCDPYTSRTHDKTGEDLYAFREYITLYDENGQKRFMVYGFLWETSLVVTVEVISEFKCLSRDSRIQLKFSDGSEWELQNTFSNCDRQVVLNLDPGQEELLQLQNSTLTHLKVIVEGFTRAEADVTKQNAALIQGGIRCLSSTLQQTPPRDTLQHQRTAEEQASNDSTRVYLVVEHPPEYFGGYEALGEFLKQNLQISRQNRVPGTVIVSFIISNHGTIQDAKVMRSVSPQEDAEVLRVVNMMPRWKPGFQNGKPVNVRFNLPVKF
jgi:TonB family protein